MRRRRASLPSPLSSPHMDLVLRFWSHRIFSGRIKPLKGRDDGAALAKVGGLKMTFSVFESRCLDRE
jgi:hypothetical protein